LRSNGGFLNPTSGTTNSTGHFIVTFTSNNTGTFIITAFASKSGYNPGLNSTQVVVLLPSLSISIISPPSPKNGSTVTSLPIILKVRITSEEIPIKGAEVYFNLIDNDTKQFGPYITDLNGRDF